MFMREEFHYNITLIWSLKLSRQKQAGHPKRPFPSWSIYLKRGGPTVFSRVTSSLTLSQAVVYYFLYYSLDSNWNHWYVSSDDGFTTTMTNLNVKLLFRRYSERIPLPCPARGDAVSQIILTAELTWQMIERLRGQRLKCTSILPTASVSILIWNGETPSVLLCPRHGRHPNANNTIHTHPYTEA